MAVSGNHLPNNSAAAEPTPLAELGIESFGQVRQRRPRSATECPVEGVVAGVFSLRFSVHPSGCSSSSATPRLEWLSCRARRLEGAPAPPVAMLGVDLMYGAGDTAAEVFEANWPTGCPAVPTSRRWENLRSPATPGADPDGAPPPAPIVDGHLEAP